MNLVRDSRLIVSVGAHLLRHQSRFAQNLDQFIHELCLMGQQYIDSLRCPVQRRERDGEVWQLRQQSDQRFFDDDTSFSSVGVCAQTAQQ